MLIRCDCRIDSVSSSQAIISYLAHVHCFLYHLSWIACPFTGRKQPSVRFITPANGHNFALLAWCIYFLFVYETQCYWGYLHGVIYQIQAAKTNAAQYNNPATSWMLSCSAWERVLIRLMASSQFFRQILIFLFSVSVWPENIQHVCNFFRHSKGTLYSKRSSVGQLHFSLHQRSVKEMINVFSLHAELILDWLLLHRKTQTQADMNGFPSALKGLNRSEMF